MKSLTFVLILDPTRLTAGREMTPPIRQRLGTMVLLALVCGTGGCRTIGRIGESRQELTARKLSRQGVQAMHHGNWNEAEKLFSNALSVSDADDRAHRGIAEAYWNRDQREDAIKHMEKAVKLSASDPRLVGRLGEMYLSVGRFADAEKQSEIALASQRDSPDIWVLRADCLREKGEHEEALAAYHRALALQPDFAQAKLHIAELYLESDQYDRLLATLDQVETTGETSLAPSRVHMLRGIAMRNLNRPDLAAKHFAKAVESDPDRAEPHLQLAAIELENGRAANASELVSLAMEIDRELVETSGWSSYVLTPEQLVALEAESASSVIR